MRVSPGPLLALLFAVTGCASGASAARPEAKPPARDALHSFAEADALAMIDDLLRESHLQPVAGWTIALPRRSRFEVDVRLGDSAFGVEWVSPDDRARDGDLLPARDPAGQLRLLSGAAGSQKAALVLLLDHESYRFAEPRPVAGAFFAPGAEEYDLHDVEQRLRRDLTEFVEYARSQYRL
jgi:hypothetical protein